MREKVFPVTNTFGISGVVSELSEDVLCCGVSSNGDGEIYTVDWSIIGG